MSQTRQICKDQLPMDRNNKDQQLVNETIKFVPHRMDFHDTQECNWPPWNRLRETSPYSNGYKTKITSIIISFLNSYIYNK
uniref:Uncharacterized protein n=1 Tax=Arion vulgaris TaxID=1028688 RepID=A0A0B6ZRE2_9EUPU